MADIATHQRRISKIVTVTYDTTIIAWSTEAIHDYILDQTAEAMRTIMLHDIKYSPLRRWNDAAWFFTWCPEQDCCLLMPYMEIVHDDIRVQRPTQYAWLRLPSYLEQMTNNPTKGALKQYTLAETIKEGLLKTSEIDQEASPSKPPKKKNKGHAIPIPIHMDMAGEGFDRQEQGKERAQGQFHDTLNFQG